MNKHKAFLWVGVLVAAAAVVLPAIRLFGVDNGTVAYLKGKPLSPWSIMALAAAGEQPPLDSLRAVSGEKAIDLEAPILALAAAGENPRSFGSENLVAKLKSFFDGVQLGEAGIINDDIFGLLALAASGERTDGAPLAGIKSFILSHQNPDGGFSFAVGGTSDTNTTAAAVMALRSGGVSANDAALANAVSYLRAAQNDDGGFPYDPKSGWGTASDASSDAWVIMALTALGEDAALWVKNGQTPAAHLNSLKQESGFYLYQAGGAEDSFTPVTTSYALLALSGKTLPVRMFSGVSAPGAPSFSVQIEGRQGLLCDADVGGETALDALKVAAAACGISYHVQESALGEYVDEIAGEKASGSSGWLYRVNGVMPSVGAGTFALADGDAVQWYFGSFDGSAVSDAFRTEVPLSVTIPAPPAPSGGSGGDAPGGGESVSMLVEVGREKSGRSGEPVGFGTAARGSVAHKTITLKNGGAVAAALSTSVSGDSVFRRYLRLNEKSWREYRIILPAAAGTTTELSLAVPADYSGSGVKNGMLVFWATAIAQ